MLHPSVESHIKNLPDRDLIAYATDKTQGYTEDAISFAREEVRKRGIAGVEFDQLCQTSDRYRTVRLAELPTPRNLPVSAAGVWWVAGLWGVTYVGEAVQKGVPLISQIGLVMIVLPYFAIVAICWWWYSESKRRLRRAWPLQVIGYLLFLCASAVPIAAVITAALPIMRQRRTTTGEVAVSLMIGVAVDAAIIALAFVLVFGRRVASHRRP